MLVLRGVHVGGFSGSCGPQHQLRGVLQTETFKKIEIKITPCEISLLKENSASAFSPSAKFCDHHVSLDTRQPFHPWKEALCLSVPTPLSPPPAALGSHSAAPSPWTDLSWTLLRTESHRWVPVSGCFHSAFGLQGSSVLSHDQYLPPFPRLYNSPLCEQTAGF